MFDIVMTNEYWIGFPNILPRLRIPDIHVGPPNTMSDIVMKNEYWIGRIIFNTEWNIVLKQCQTLS